jgi:hypothetical protein
MFNFKSVEALQSVLKTVYREQPGPGGVALFAAALQEHFDFTPEQARRYSESVLTANSEDSADAVHRNASRLVGQWSSGSSAGSAGTLVVSNMETWTFSDNLTYEHKYESYEGYVSPFGGGYSSPRSRSSRGTWAPSDAPTSPFKIILIDESGDCRNASIEWTAPEQMFSPAMRFNSERFARM